MPAYHSKFNEEDFDSPYGVAILPLRPDFEGEDIIDEAINSFRCNIYFKNFEIKGTADRTLIFCMVCITKILQIVQKAPEEDKALKNLSAFTKESISKITDSKFFMK